MEGLLFLLALVPIALLVLLIINISKMNGLREEVRLMRLQMQELMKSLAHRPAGASSPIREVPPTPAPATTAPPPQASVITPSPVPEPIPVPPQPPAAPPVVVIPPQRAEPLHALREELREQQAAAASKPMAVPEKVIIAPPPPPRPPPPPKPPKPSFLDRNPDLEKFIGENLINKIGIAILVLGLGFLLKYAIGQGYISETGRTLIGVGSGALLIFFAHRLREKFRAFSSVLVGGGLAVLYFSITIAFQDYKIIEQTPAFLVMVGITAIGILLTLVYDRRELAVIALLGGFAAPFLTSRGDGSYIVLFSYLLILNTGMLVLANYKKWHLINVIAFLLTSAIFGGWLSMRFVDLEPRPVWPAMGFATAFFLVFFIMNLRYNLKHGSSFVALDFSLLLANTAVYFAAGLSILQNVKPSLDGLFVIVLAAFHLVFAWMFYKRINAPKHLVYLLIGLVLTFLSLAGPLQLDGNHITLFWAAECVLLLWFSQRTGIRLVERASMLVVALMLISLMMDLAEHYGAVPVVRLAPVLNKAWITGTVAAIALYLYGRMCMLLPADRTVLPGLSPKLLRNAAWVLCAATAYGVNFLEIGHQLGFILSANVVVMALTAYSLAAFAGMYFITRKGGQAMHVAVLVLLILGLLYHITGFYGNSFNALLDLRTGTGGAGFTGFHVAAFVAVLVAVICVARTVRVLAERSSPGWTFYLWGMCVFLVVFASQELDHAMLAFVNPVVSPDAMEPGLEEYYVRDGFTEALRSARKAGYPILWGLGSFVLMWYGMRTRQRMVRIIALSLFGLTLLKLFLYDLRGISEGGKVAAFICLGILLLVVSFMYNKLKVILQDDQRSADEKNSAGSAQGSENG
jgi:uncharacterized membrane protein